MKLPLELPSLPEQRRIAEILDKADALSAKRRAAIAQLDGLTQSIFLEMFGAGSHSPVTADRKGGKHDGGWEWEPLTDVAELATGHRQIGNVRIIGTAISRG